MRRLGCGADEVTAGRSETAEEVRVVIRAERTATLRPALTGELTLLPGDEPGDRSHEGDEDDEDDPEHLGEAADLLVVGLDAVHEGVDGQSQAAGHGKDAKHGSIVACAGACLRTLFGCCTGGRGRRAPPSPEAVSGSSQRNESSISASSACSSTPG